MKARGFTQIQMIAAVVALGLLLAGGYLVKSYIDGVDRRAHERGVAETTAKWEARERTQLQAYQVELDRLRRAGDARVAVLQAELNDTERDYLRRLADEQMENDRTRRGLRDGSIMFVDPGRPAGGEACRSEGGAGPAAPAAGDAEAGGELSAETSGFLWGEAERADAIAEELTFAQDVIVAYYKLARDCQAQR